MLLRNNTPYLVYQETDYYHEEAKECIVKVSTVIFHCGMYSYTSLVDPGYTPTEIVIDRQTCADAFVTQKIKIAEGVMLEAKPGFITKQRVYRVGEITSSKGACTSGTWTYKGVQTSGLVVIENYEIQLKTFKVLFNVNSQRMKPYPPARPVISIVTLDHQ